MESASIRFTGPFSKVTLQYDGETSSTMNCAGGWAEAVMAPSSGWLAVFAPVEIPGPIVGGRAWGVTVQDARGPDRAAVAGAPARPIGPASPGRPARPAARGGSRCRAW